MRFLSICAIAACLLLTGFTQANTSRAVVAPPMEEAAPEPDALHKAHQWVLDFMVNTVPPGRKIYYPEGQETEEEALVRYKDVAWDIVRTAYDPDTKPLFTSKKSGRSRTAAVWMGIMLLESGFMKHVDLNIGPHARGDNGWSWCLMQLRIGKGKTIEWNYVKDRRVYWGDPKEEIFHGYTGPELIEDRQRCLLEGHKLIRLSFKACEDLPLTERLTAYTVGKCAAKPHDDEDIEYVGIGKAKSRARMKIAVAYFKRTQFSRGFDDRDVVNALEAEKGRDRVSQADKDSKKFAQSL